MPNVRTATTATDRSSTGGICQARVISQADTPASASALPSDSDAERDGQQKRGSSDAAAARRPNGQTAAW